MKPTFSAFLKRHPMIFWGFGVMIAAFVWSFWNNPTAAIWTFSILLLLSVIALFFGFRSWKKRNEKFNEVHK